LAPDLRGGAFESFASRDRKTREILWRLTIAKLHQADPRYLAVNGLSELRLGDHAMSQTRVPQVIDASARGEIVVVTDDDDRESEGDIILAAVHTTPEKVGLYGR